jgi:antitoxin ParD1/3/4
MEFHLTPELEEFVKNEVQSGRYHSTSEVVADALGLLAEHAKVRAAQIAELNEELTRRIAEADAGEFVDPAALRAHLALRSAERRKKSA